MTESATQRSEKGQKKSYLRKKRRHTIKTKLGMEETGKLFSITKSHLGSVHDFKIRKQEQLLPMKAIKIANNGYQGWQKLQSNIVSRYKRSKKKPLNKEHNKQLFSQRMGVEHKLSELKVFKILAEVYRNF